MKECIKKPLNYEYLLYKLSSIQEKLILIRRLGYYKLYEPPRRFSTKGCLKLMKAIF